MEFGPSAFAGPPATMAESSPSRAPGRVTLPPIIISVYEFAVKQQQDLAAFPSAAFFK